jgi:hypothetical protein
LDGTIHPDNQPVFLAQPVFCAAFNLQFPPPAFIGDIDTAPVVLLIQSGGYKPASTPAEFPDAKAIDDFRGYLHGELSSMPGIMAGYYRRHSLGPWMENGRVACPVPGSRPGRGSIVAAPRHK